MILAAKGKDKESRKQLKQGFKKKYFFLYFCQSSSKHELNLTLGSKEVYIISSTWGPKMSNNTWYGKKFTQSKKVAQTNTGLKLYHVQCTYWIATQPDLRIIRRLNLLVSQPFSLYMCREIYNSKGRDYNTRVGL